MRIRYLWLGIVAATLATSLCLSAADLLPATRPTSSPAAREIRPGPAVIIPLAGEVDNYNRDALVRNFERARKMGATTVILEIDTYGGLVSSGLEISGFLKRQNDVHVIAYVKDKAISAGAMIALACDEIVMQPSSRLGDCAPIIFKSDQSLEALPPDERDKQVSPVRTDFEDSARRNGYDPLLVTAMVYAPVTVYCVENTEGSRRFVDEPTFKSLTADGEWKPAAGLPSPIDGPTTLLTVMTDEALKLHLAKGEAASADVLASERGLTIVADLSPSWGEGLVALLQHPATRTVLMTIFMMSLYIALNVPGHGAAEAVALMSVSLLVGIPLLTGYAQWWEVMLIFVGLALVAFEIFVFPGHMVSAIVGSLMMLVGLVFTFIGDVFTVPGAWHMPATWASLQSGLWAVVGALVTSMLLSAWLRSHLPRVPVLRNLILTATTATPADPTAPHPARDASMQDQWPFVGTVGRAVTDLRPGGSAEFAFADDTRISAVVSESGYVEAGTKLLVKEVHGNRVVVRAMA